MVNSFGGTWFVHCMEAVRISEGLSWEVPLLLGPGWNPWQWPLGYRYAIENLLNQ